jgi:hypothetical protein
LKQKKESVNEYIEIAENEIKSIQDVLASA